MLVAVVQINPIFGEIKSNVENAISMMENVRADLYILPELFNTGYNFIDEKEVNLLSEMVPGFTFHAMSQFAKKKLCYIVYGFAEKAEKFYNSSAFVGPEGLIGIYRKVHLFYKENLFFTSGNLGFPVFDIPFGKVGMMICFDWIFPESVRTLALKGAQLIVHPSNLILPHCPDSMITRCLENRIFTATANRVGEEDRGGLKLRFIGKSEIVSPLGEILARLGEEETKIAVVDIDLSLSNNKQINEYNNLFKDRKPKHYLN